MGNVLSQITNNDAPVHVKTVYNGDYRRFQLNPVTFINLENTVRTIYSLFSPLVLSFQDEEQDWVQLTSTEDLLYAIELVGSPLRVGVKISDTVTPFPIFSCDEVEELQKKKEPSHVEKKEELPYVEKKEEPPYVEKREEPPYVEKKEELPYVEKKEEPPYVEKNEELPDAEKDEGLPNVEKEEFQDGENEGDCGEEEDSVEYVVHNTPEVPPSSWRGRPGRGGSRRGRGCGTPAAEKTESEKLEANEIRLKEKITDLQLLITSGKLSTERDVAVRWKLSRLQQNLDIVTAKRASLQAAVSETPIEQKECNEEPEENEKIKPQTKRGRRGGRDGGRGGRGRRENDNVGSRPPKPSRRLPPEILQNLRRCKVDWMAAKDTGDAEKIAACKTALLLAKEAKLAALAALRVPEPETTALATSRGQDTGVEQENTTLALGQDTSVEQGNTATL